MVLNDFVSLSVPEQWDELWEYGIRITAVDTQQGKFSLYALHGFYVDVLSDEVTNKVLENYAFIDDDRIEKYIIDIEVSID